MSNSRKGGGKMFLRGIKISHKILFVIISGLVVFAILTLETFMIGKEQINTLEVIYEQKVKPLDNLRKIQLIFREIEYRMAGVAADIVAPIGSGEHLKQSLKDIEILWNNTEKSITDSKLLKAKKTFEKGYNGFKGMVPELQKAYFDEKIGKVEDLYDKWLDFKPLIFKSIDAMAEAQEKSVNTYYRQGRQFVYRTNRFVFIISTMIGLVFLISALLIIRSINRPIRIVVKAAKQVAGGDLTYRINLDSKDEMGTMASELNRMLIDLRNTFSKIAQGINTVSSNAERLSNSSESLLSGTEQQRAQVDQVLAASTEMSQTILDIAKNASEASEAARESSSMAGEGKKVVCQAVDSIMRLVDSVSDTSKTIEKLGTSSKEIDEIISVIQDIADLTNLLALNAAIEAARVGEQGRGFAVVADEVKKLAEKTAKATEEIAEKIRAIQRGTEDSMSVMERGKSLTDEAVSTARKAGDALQKIAENSDRVMDMVQRIATATEQQSSAAEEVSQSMEHAAEVINGTVQLSEEVKLSANELSSVGQELRNRVRRFKTGNNGDKITEVKTGKVSDD